MEEVAACGGCEEALAWLNAVCRHGVSAQSCCSTHTLHMCAKRCLCPLLSPQKATPRNSLFSYFRGQTKQSDLTVGGWSRLDAGSFARWSAAQPAPRPRLPLVHAQLAVVNLISACCKAVFPSSESPGLGLDCQAAATYLYYM